MSARPLFRGTLLSDSFARSRLRGSFQGRLGEREAIGARSRLTAWRKGTTRLVGPVSSARTILDRGAVPLLNELGYRVAAPATPIASGSLIAALDAGKGPAVGLLVATWDTGLGELWRRAVHLGIGLQTGWCLCFNGQHLRIVDTRRTYARRFLEFDLDTALADDAAFALMWGLLRAPSVAESPTLAAAARDGARSLLDEIISACDRHQAGVNRSLQHGVRAALVDLVGAAVRRSPRGPGDAAVPFEHCLTLVYRLLFLLYAEARLLVPLWHPTYRQGYSVETLREAAEHAPSARGIGEAVRAMTRLAGRGCRAGDLIVTAFDGPLFDLSRASALDRLFEDDAAVRRALVSISTRERADGPGRERIAYADLGVEQLGGVYEQVIDCVPKIETTERGGGELRLVHSGVRRKATGTFYTPRSVTEYLVRRTLSPLVADVSPEDLLRLRILDPAMGSGAFLVAACKYLAAAYEESLQRTKGYTADDFDDGDRAEFRRLVAQRCLVGVDVNPMAVELARLSLWLTTLSARHPLTFLDHHLRTGDSLIGASLEDLARQPPGGRTGGRRLDPTLPLFDVDAIRETMRAAVPSFARISTEPGDTVAAIRQKERALAELHDPGSRLSRWRRAANLWCASWLWPSPETPPDRAVFHALVDLLVRGRSPLSPAQAQIWLDRAETVAAERGAFHWSLEFPEIFFDDGGHPRANPGFDAVLSNPPWDMVRADAGPAADREGARAATRRFVRFIRHAGIFHPRQHGHVNRYQLFIERILLLARRGGRIGLVVPAGLATDQSAAHHRRLLLERCETDGIVGFENRRAIFPVHRGVRFLLVTATKGGRTAALPCRFGEQDPAALDDVPDVETGSHAGFRVVLSTAFLERMSGASLVIPELRTPLDVAIAGKLYDAHPPLGSARSWRAQFGRELNASDDRGLLERGTAGLPVIEGKHLAPFVVDLSAVRHRVRATAASRRLRTLSTLGRSRLACRDITSAQNRLTLIAAVIPARSVTTHTVLCLKTPLDLDSQHFLCGVLNSFVANYLMRLQVSSHVTAAGLARLPVPRLDSSASSFREIAAVARGLAARSAGRDDASARIQALVARLYGLTPSEFDHMLGTFPLVDPSERQRALTLLRTLG